MEAASPRGRPNAAEHRPDLDGMRALSILAVVSYHAFPSLAPGGFAGVDIFFLISGYLITGIIIQDTARGAFSIIEFYKRRIRRIFPALLVVLSFTAFLGWLYLLPSEYVQVGTHIWSASGFFSNFQLASEGNYFDFAASRKPLIHLWSLAVEEQFYLLWPIVLLLTARHRRVQLILMLTLCLVSLGYWLFLGHDANTGIINQSFYLPHARAWELATGSVIAHLNAALRDAHAQSPSVPSQPPTPGSAKYVPNIALLGALGVIVAAIAIPSTTFMPSYMKPILVQLGAGVIVVFGGSSSVGQSLLANAPMRYLGRISYPLYLWHWPLIAFDTIFRGHPGPRSSRVAATLGIILFACILASLTYHAVELPLKRRRFTGRLAFVACGVLVALGGVGLLIKTGRVPPRTTAYLGEGIVDAADNFWNRGYAALSQQMGTGVPLAFGRRDQRVLLVGDSYAIHYWPRIEYLLAEFGQRSRGIVFATSFGCSPTPGWHSHADPTCEKNLRQLRKYEQDKTIDRVVISANWPAYFLQGNDWYDNPLCVNTTLVKGANVGFASLEELVRQFEAHGKQVYIIMALPFGARVDPTRMIVRHLLPPSLELRVRSWSRSDLTSALYDISHHFRSVAAATSAIAIDPLEELCDPRTCPSVANDGSALFERGGHLNPTFVRSRLRYLDPIFLDGAPEANRAAVSGVSAKLDSGFPNMP